MARAERERALELFKQGLDRGEIRKILTGEFPHRNSNVLRIEISEAAKILEKELENGQP